MAKASGFFQIEFQSLGSRRVRILLSYDVLKLLPGDQVGPGESWRLFAFKSDEGGRCPSPRPLRPSCEVERLRQFE